MKTILSFTDKNRNLVTIEISDENNYLSFSGETQNSLGQIDFEPKNKPQEDLIKFWDSYHLKYIDDLDSNTLEDLQNLISEIEEIEEEEKERKVTEEDLDLFKDFNEPEKALVLAIMFNLSINEIEDIENINGNYWSVQGIDYLFGTDEEMNDEWDDDLENYIDECLEIPEHIQNYFDREAWKSDAKIDGRGHSLNRYDGGEEEYKYNDTYYYAYRQ